MKEEIKGKIKLMKIKLSKKGNRNHIHPKKK
jgi:hypothetical protein